MTKLNGVALYKNNNNRHQVIALFHGEQEIVFEGINHSECLRYCHQIGVKMMAYDRWFTAVNASFRKVNAKRLSILTTIGSQLLPKTKRRAGGESGVGG